jgi:hypothetical protein
LIAFAIGCKPNPSSPKQLYSQLRFVGLSNYVGFSNFEKVKSFVSKYREEGYDPTKFHEERKIITKFGTAFKKVARALLMKI